MKRLSLTLVNKTPFSIATSRAVTNVQETLDFIPGTAIRGALAGIWLKNKKPDDEFKEIFTGDKVFFGNFYPAGSKPIPLSAYSCKYYRGFLDGEKHGTMDMLFTLIREKETGNPVPDSFLTCQCKKDRKACNAPMKRTKGYYKKNFSDGSLELVSVAKRLVFHTAISPVVETAHEATLYSQEVVEKETIFKGDILIHDDFLMTKLESFISNLRDFYLGSDKSTGLGKFEIKSLIPDGFDEVKIKDSLKKGITMFNSKLSLGQDKSYFSITLQSDNIITDKFLRYKSFVGSEDIGLPDAEPILGIAETRRIQGWNTMAKIPREDVAAIEKGSVFVFAVRDLNDYAIDRLYDAEIFGLGKRKSEGFGRVTVCDCFHLEEGLK